MGFFSKKEDKKVLDAQQASAISHVPGPEPLRVQKQSSALMNPQQVQRTREAKRLAETKLKNIEDSLLHLREQQEWLRRYNELNVLLEREKANLYELNKQQSMLADTRAELERFETFETVQGKFLRLQELEKMTATNKRDRSQVDHDWEQTHMMWEEQQKVQQLSTERRLQAEEHLHQVQDQLSVGYRSMGAMEMLETEADKLQKTIATLQMDWEKTEQDIREHTDMLEQVQYELERHRAGRQTMEMYESMLVHGESILLQLDRMKEVQQNLIVLRGEMNEAVKRQDEENEMLGRTFGSYQDVEAKIQTLNDEIRVHRSSMKGQDSFTLQEHAMRLKSNYQMLLSAQSLWNRISTGYLAIESCNQRLNSLRLKIDHATMNVRQLETEVSRLRSLAHEKEYTYMLSKSQNVIQLRADLKEGVSCSVCGANHHPYHSDTMLEQSKLIGEFKTEYELLASECSAKEETLMQEKLELASLKAMRQVEEDSMVSLRQRQSEDVREWHIFSHLDRSFQDCSASTNLEARQSMLRQLIENTKRDSEIAQKVLDEFSFHQNSVNDLTEELSKLELEKNDLSMRLNEVNTGCQVMAGQTERIKQMIAATNETYSHLYEQMERMITVPDWLNEWTQNPEGLKLRIQQLMESWNVLNRQIDDEQGEEKVEMGILEAKHAQLQLIQSHIELLKNRLEECGNRTEEQRKIHDNALDKQNAKMLYAQLHSQIEDARRDELRDMETTRQLQQQLDYMRGRQETHVEIGEKLAAKCVDVRSELDIWIHNFNAQNPPVQYSELERVFMQEKDWNDVRKRIRKVMTDAALSQAKVDDIQSRLIGLQAEGGRSSIHAGNDLLSSLVNQREALESRRSETMMQIARLSVALEDHEKAQRQKVNIQVDEGESTPTPSTDE